MVGTRSQRVPLSSLTALTLHADRPTAARRTSPLPQLTCRGSPCASYQPRIVQCVAVGSSGPGSGIEWKCDADLPRGVRFGALEVGCEGWDGPGDAHYVLRGSCALEYELVRAATALEDDYALGGGGRGGYGGYLGKVPPRLRGYVPRSSAALFNSAFNLVFAALTAYLALSLLAKLARRFFPARRFGAMTGGRTLGGGGGYPGGGGGRGGGPGPSHGGPPPPYTPTPTPTPKPAPPHHDHDGGAPWRPGFWTGAAAGWAANALLGAGAARPRAYERERERVAPLDYAAAFGEGRDVRMGRARAAAQRRGWGGAGGTGGGAGGFGFGAAQRRFDDEGSGGAGGGGLRRSTGFGGTSVR
ncbi:hypothetical protein JCM9279_000203 [Rhodotorula babjevae]